MVKGEGAHTRSFPLFFVLSSCAHVSCPSKHQFLEVAAFAGLPGKDMNALHLRHS